MIKSAINIVIERITDNLIEIWLGIILFLALPIVAALYFDYRAFLAVSLSFQVISVLFLYRESKREKK